MNHHSPIRLTFDDDARSIKLKINHLFKYSSDDATEAQLI